MTEPFFTFISFLGALQGVLLAVLFFARRAHSPARYMFAAYILLFSLGLLEPFLKQNLPGTAGQLAYSFLGSSNFAYGPLLYLFVCFLASPSPRLSLRHLLHFAPFLLCLGADLALNLRSTRLYDTLEFILFELLIAQILAYNLLAILKLRKEKAAILRLRPGFRALDLGRLYYLLIFLTAIYVFSFAITHLVAFGVEKAGVFYTAVQALIALSIYLMSYLVLMQPRFFDLGDEPRETPGKYQRSGLRDQQAVELAARITAFMQEQKPYLDPNLSIHTLAQQLDLSKNHLTQVINEKMKMNFYEFVNAYRVEEVKRLMDEPGATRYNLPALGLKAGFRSKTAFNINFRKHTGKTPSEWKNPKRSVNMADGTSLNA